jgi:hypothetical protein
MHEKFTKNTTFLFIFLYPSVESYDKMPLSRSQSFWILSPFSQILQLHSKAFFKTSLVTIPMISGRKEGA